MGNKGGKDASKTSAHQDGTTSKKDKKVKVPLKLSKKDYQAITKQTGLEEKEVKEIFDKFMAGNPDGKLDKAEFIKLYTTLRKEPPSNLDEIVNFIFQAFDTNNDGTLTFNEFVIGYAITTEGKLEHKLAYSFELYDVDDSGTLTVQELKAGLTAMLDLLGADKKNYNVDSLVQECISILDSNKDGKISKDEFVNGLSKNYSLRVLMSPFN